MYKGIIYYFKNKVNNKYYIGQTVRPTKRYQEHLTGNKQLLDKAITKYGADSFEYGILEEVKETSKRKLHKKLNSLEKHYIKLYNSKTPNGYNVLDGGNSIKEYIKYKIKSIFKKLWK